MDGEVCVHVLGSCTAHRLSRLNRCDRHRLQTHRCVLFDRWFLVGMDIQNRSWVIDLSLHIKTSPLTISIKNSNGSILMYTHKVEQPRVNEDFMNEHEPIRKLAEIPPFTEWMSLSTLRERNIPIDECNRPVYQRRGLCRNSIGYFLPGKVSFVHGCSMQLEYYMFFILE